MNNPRLIWMALLVAGLTACGGGGGGGGGGTNIGIAPTPPPAAPPATPPAATPLPAGLTSGGVGIVNDTTIVGVQLDVAVGGTGMWVGDIQDFSSVVLNDDTVNTDASAFSIEGSPGSQSDLRQGQQVLIVGAAGTNTATEVRYRSNVKGPLTSLSITDPELATATLQVLGQTVLTDATTTFANVDLVDLLVDDLLEVSGVLDDAGQLRASYVERKSALAEYKVIGVALNVTATNFSLDSLDVDYSSASLSDFDNNAIVNGNVVEARGPVANFTAPGVFAAVEVERLPILTVGSQARVELEGFIDRFAAADDFDVQNTPISTDGNTLFVNGSSASLALGVKVQIEGTEFNGTTLASRVTIQPTDAIRVEGNIEDIRTNNGTVTVLGIQFQIRDLTRLEDKTSADVDPLTIDDLGIGDEVEIRGYLDASTVVATRLERDDPRDRARLRGPVFDENALVGTVTILNVRVSGSDDPNITEYQDSDDMVITQQEFHTQVATGDFIKAVWDIFVDTTQLADEISIED